MNFEGAKNFMLNKLKKELKRDLTYHSISHTLDVLESAIRLAEMEKMNSKDVILLKTAAVFHDAGMLKTYIGHEDASTEIARDVLPAFTYDQDSIDIICDMIMTTKLPQAER